MVAGDRSRSTAVVSAETSDAAAAHKGEYLGGQAQPPWILASLMDLVL
jgi:hypothetical protein